VRRRAASRIASSFQDLVVRPPAGVLVRWHLQDHDLAVNGHLQLQMTIQCPSWRQIQKNYQFRLIVTLT
jgi:hypothetical protein